MKFGCYEINDIVYDSRKAAPGTAFVCLVGAKSDGHNYAEMAYNKGARVFFAERALELPCDAIVVLCEDTRIKLAQLSREFYGYPDKELKIIGITGTKGKTTISNMITDILERGGKKAGVIGTNGVMFNGVRTPTVNTTPESRELYRTFREMVDGGVEYCVMEVSSQAVKLDRIHGINFDIGVFTNLSPDHIGEGEHADYEEYADCKARFFEQCKIALFNSDDEAYPDIAKYAKGNVLTYSVNDGDYLAKDIKRWSDKNSLGMEFVAVDDSVSTYLRVSTPGIYSVYNALCVYAVCKLAGLTPATIAKEMPKVRVKGRFEIIDALDYATFIIDYAHNALSLENVLSTVKSYSPRKLTVLFGSVGERTQLRRRELAEVADKYCDFAIITSDNPGNEPPENIIKDIESAIKRVPYVSIADRVEAVEYAVRNAEAGEVVVFAGKGHEDYQLIGNEKVPFSEAEIIQGVSAKIRLGV